ncbi:putative zinc-binding oxidoreductase ToxD [Tothia fuscella]|uniref:Zinc-binding oxidoreductase ToxD n=1 Tax=Tothia fuscella TaxID=1048955 RepID=A0A9P4NN19_9PEZI|nr:putative zinc-binding oxidoreductase ToxD [Tothia fuscella]
MRALKVVSLGKAEIVSDAPIPSLRPDYILVKTVAIALNPTDWKSIKISDRNITIGCDYAGIVQEVGDKVTKPFKKGDRVAGFVLGANASQFEDGADAEYLVAKADLQIKIPDYMSFEEAATFGVGITTIGQGLYREFNLPWPDEPSKDKFPILIYGGSTATGALAIQWAKLSGLEVITTCSPRNFEYVKSLGADLTFDYSSPDVGKKIREHTNNKLLYAYDTIGENSSPQICADALSSERQPNGEKPQYCVILRTELPRDDVDQHQTFGSTAIGEAFEKAGGKFEGNKEHFEHSKIVWAKAQKLLEEKKFKPHRYEVRPGGLDGIVGGLDDLKNGKISGVKVVYRISDPEQPLL